MDEILVFPDGKSIPPDGSRLLLDLCLERRIDIAHACGGNAKCSTCRVFVRRGMESVSPRSEAEAGIASRLRLDDRVRLACQARVNGSASIRRLVLDHDDEISVVESIAAGVPGTLGEEIEAAILFCDIRGFTPLAARLAPYDTIYVLNRFHAVAEKVTTRHGGKIVNTMGDGFLALFRGAGAAVDCERAVDAGLELFDALGGLREFLETAFQETLRIGVGIHFGSMIAGRTGRGEFARSTVIGGSVNRASRIESATKSLHADLLVSEVVRELTRSRHAWRSAGIASLAGVGDEELFRPLAERELEHSGSTGHNTCH